MWGRNADCNSSLADAATLLNSCFENRSKVGVPLVTLLEMWHRIVWQIQIADHNDQRNFCRVAAKTRCRMKWPCSCFIFLDRGGGALRHWKSTTNDIDKSKIHMGGPLLQTTGGHRPVQLVADAKLSCSNACCQNLYLLLKYYQNHVLAASMNTIGADSLIDHRHWRCKELYR